MDTILYLSGNDTLRFKNVENFTAIKKDFGYDVEFDYKGESTGLKRHLVMTGLIGYSNSISGCDMHPVSYNHLMKGTKDAHQETLRSAT